MADTITSSYDLKLEYLFEDDDTRTVTIPNPRENLASADIVSAETILVNTNTFVGDKTGAAFKEIQSAKIVSTTRRKLDLN